MAKLKNLFKKRRRSRAHSLPTLGNKQSAVPNKPISIQSSPIPTQLSPNPTQLSVQISPIPSYLSPNSTKNSSAYPKRKLKSNSFSVFSRQRKELLKRQPSVTSLPSATNHSSISSPITTDFSPNPSYPSPIPSKRSPIPLNLSALKRKLQLTSNSFAVFSRQRKKLWKRKASFVSANSLYSDDNLSSITMSDCDQRHMCGDLGSIVLVSPSSTCRHGFGSHLPDSFKLGIVIITFLITTIQSIVVWIII